MNFFKKLSETVIDTASTIGSKSADLVETGKLKLQRNQLDAMVEDKKTVIGDLVYSAHQQNSTPNVDSLSKIIAEITELEKQIKSVDEKLGNEIFVSSEPKETSSDPNCCPQCGQNFLNKE